MTPLNFITLITRKPNLVAADIDGDLVMSIEQGEYFGITGVGPRVSRVPQLIR
jgi:hypothetical protein